MNEKIIPQRLRKNQYDKLNINCDRGFRIETYITLGSNTTMFHSEIDPIDYLDSQIAYYKDYNVKLAQVYVYLNEYCKKPLDHMAFSQLENYFAEVKKRRMRIILRFAYEFDVNRKIGPTSKMIYEHQRQIGEWFLQNEKLIRDTVLVLQAGMIGAWGEWHTAKHYHNKKKILEGVCQMAPYFLSVQVRNQKLRENIKNTPYFNKIAYHDDYLVGVYHKWSTPSDKPLTAPFNDFVEESKITLNDGEMPWGKDTYYNKGFIDGREFLKGCSLRSLTTLSLTHNFIEDNNEYNMHRWQNEFITEDDAENLGLHFYREYFDGEKRSIFDFLNDHLGYQLSADFMEIKNGEITVKISNMGFAPPIDFSDFRIYTENRGEIIEYKVKNYSPLSLTSGKSVTAKIKAKGKVQRLGIKISKNVTTIPSIRLLNECEYKNDINWFLV